jgi:pyruvate-formate lyase-activating enzyme
VTIDATSGKVFDGRLPIVPGVVDDDPDLVELASWAREETGDGAAASLPALLKARAARRTGEAVLGSGGR